MADAPSNRPSRVPLRGGEGAQRHPPGWKVHPSPDGRGAPPPPKQPMLPRLGSKLWLLILLVFVVNYFVASRELQRTAPVRIPYSPTFLKQLDAGNIESITSKADSIDGQFVKPISYPDASAKPNARFHTQLPTFANGDALTAKLIDKGVVVNATNPSTGASLLTSILLGFGPTLLFVGLLIFFMRRMAGGAGGISSFGRSRAKRYEDSATRVTFEDVAGIEEAKAELAEIVDFLRNPDRYRKLGGRIPRGVLLTGAPGTGKTLLARAVAGEAQVPFFSMSASEFIEMIVGVGASRVRDLFGQAKAAAPAIIFIDELDAIGRSRSASSGFGGGSDEREQTLNQILTEMDGFDSSTGVIVLAATNRPDVLDQALLRPGRFDRRVTVQAPDKRGRRLILDVHSRSLPLADDVDLDGLAATTPGMVGADLANLVNEAALLAARRSHTAVERADFTDALEKILLGAERSVMLSKAERERTAYHEAGHAIVGMLTPGADPVRKVSIIPRGVALGVTLSAPSADRFNYDERYLHAKIKTALGGRVAEQVVLGDVTTGAESDIQQLTLIARQMVGRWGMSEAIGPIAVIADSDRGPLLPGVEETSQHTQELVDREVQRIVDEAYQEVVALITANRDKLESLARALLREETLDEREAYAAAGIERIADEPDEHAPDGPPGAAAPPAAVAIDYPGTTSHPLGEETP